MIEHPRRGPIHVDRSIPTTRAGRRLLADLERPWTDDQRDRSSLQRSVLALVRAGILLAETEARNGR